MHRRTLLKLTGATALSALLHSVPARARRVFPKIGGVEFMALRHGQVVGSHRIRFSRAGGAFQVRTDIEIEVGSLGVPLYRFVHHAEETWVDGWLHGVVSDTDDDGRLYRLRAERLDGIFQGAVNGAAFTVSGYIIPTSLWHRDTPATKILFDTTDAMVKSASPRYLGRDDVPVKGVPVTAKHYALGGEVGRDVWYDDECNLVRIAFLLRDGTQIVLEPK